MSGRTWDAGPIPLISLIPNLLEQRADIFPVQELRISIRTQPFTSLSDLMSDRAPLDLGNSQATVHAPHDASRVDL